MKYNKKQYINEGRAIGGGPFQYGGFPKVIKEENANLHGEVEKHHGIISSYGMMLHDTNHPDRFKFGKAFDEFAKGKYDNADELIKMGANPEAIGNYIAIKTSPEYKAEMEKTWKNIDPQNMGYGKPGEPSRWTGD